MSYIDESQLLEYLRQARSAYEKGDVERAYMNAREALNLDPYNEYAQKLSSKAGKTILKQRKAEYKKRLKEIESKSDISSKQKLAQYEELLQFYPKSTALRLKISALKKRIINERVAEAKALKKQIKSTAKMLVHEERYLDAITFLKNQYIHFAGEPWLEELITKYKHDYVISELRKHTFYLEKGEYENLYRFLTKLYTLFPEKRIKKYIHQAELLVIDKRNYDNRVFIQESLELINSLYNQGRYEDCMQTCEELTAHSGSSFQIKMFFDKSKKLNEKEMDRMIDILMEKVSMPLDADNDEEWIKI